MKNGYYKLLALILTAAIFISACDVAYFKVIDGQKESLTEAIGTDFDKPDQVREVSKIIDEPLSNEDNNEALVQLATEEASGEQGTDYDEDVIDRPGLSLDAYKEKIEARGIYLSSNTAGISSVLQSRVEFLGQKSMNAMVIDVKDDFGNVTFKDKIPIADELGVSVSNIGDIDQVLADLEANGVYSIARVVVFKDKVIADARPDFIIPLEDGSEYWERDGSGNPEFCWLNPYNKDVWEYVLDIATGAAELGFDEIQFDYVRFPTDRNIKLADFGNGPGQQGDISFIDAITDFSRYAMERLEPYDVKVSADVFGTVIYSDLDASLIGQDFVKMAGIFDILSPMVYPSHFGPNVFGVDNPDLDPYAILNETFKHMRGELGMGGAVIRPWLQDFTATWLSNHKTYGGAEIKAQIQACYDNNIMEWLLWDPSNRYNGATNGL